MYLFPAEIGLCRGHLHISKHYCIFVYVMVTPLAVKNMTFLHAVSPHALRLFQIEIIFTVCARQDINIPESMQTHF